MVPPRSVALAGHLFRIAAVAAFAAAVGFTWRRLFLGMDLQDESYYVLVPWRWAVGDGPFVNEQNPGAGPRLPGVPVRQGVRGPA